MLNYVLKNSSEVCKSILVKPKAGYPTHNFVLVSNERYGKHKSFTPVLWYANISEYSDRKSYFFHGG